MAEEEVSQEEEYYDVHFVNDIVIIFQIMIIIVIIGAISSFMLDDEFTTQSVNDKTMIVSLIICGITSMILASQICGSQIYAANRQLLYSMGSKQRLRTYNRELLRRGNLGYNGILWFSSFLILASGYIRWMVSE